eukprot:scaffold1277_cov253-Pinguiococcus_pyrenoidosus.AAC.44
MATRRPLASGAKSATATAAAIPRPNRKRSSAPGQQEPPATAAADLGCKGEAADAADRPRRRQAMLG